MPHNQQIYVYIESYYLVDSVCFAFGSNIVNNFNRMVSEGAASLDCVAIICVNKLAYLNCANYRHPSTSDRSIVIF